MDAPLVAPLADFGKDDVHLVGGKNASLGELLRALDERGVRVPQGVAVTVAGFELFLSHNDLHAPIEQHMAALRAGEASLEETGATIRRLIGRGEYPPELEEAIRSSYLELSQLYDKFEVDVAVRSSATAEDLPDASFAGQQDTILNVTGDIDVLRSVRRCYTSLFTDRAIHYRAEKGFDTQDVSLSVTIQKMVRAGSASAGVVFTIEPDTGFPDVVVVNGSWGLGEHLVGGEVEPDEWIVYKPFIDNDSLVPIISKTRGAKETKMVYTRGEVAPVKTVDTRRREREAMVLDDSEVMELARWAKAIEDHYGHPMDVEWAKDGETGELFVVQARPETVQSRAGAGSVTSYSLKTDAAPAVTGIAIGESIASGPVKVLAGLEDAHRFEDGDVLVTEMTDPDWVPLMSRASAVVTDRGGRTAHAAIISRELGVTAVVGSAEATETFQDGEIITVSCADGESGKVYRGKLDWTEEQIDLTSVPETRTQVMMNLASPGAALRWWQLPADGIGLARMEFIINDHIKVHPLALLDFDHVTDTDVRHEIEELAVGYDELADYFSEKITYGVATIAASQYPNPVIVRLSDFKSNEYADMIGGRQFEPDEENPMLGWRGAARYDSQEYGEAFALEVQAVAKARDVVGLDNIIPMVPFCRTLEQADRVLEILAQNGLERGKDGLQVYVMAEIPANVLLTKEFAERFDGFSIGSNDLTQLVLGVDRDSDRLSDLFDERNPAVKKAISMIIKAAKEAGAKVGICGQGPSDHPDFAEFLVREGIDSISLNPDVVVSTRHRVAELEASLADSD